MVSASGMASTVTRPADSRQLREENRIAYRAVRTRRNDRWLLPRAAKKVTGIAALDSVVLSLFVPVHMSRHSGQVAVRSQSPFSGRLSLVIGGLLLGLAAVTICSGGSLWTSLVRRFRN